MHLWDIVRICAQACPILDFALLNGVKVPILPSRLRVTGLIEAQDVDEVIFLTFVLLIEHVDDAIGLTRAVDNARFLFQGALEK